MGCMGGPKLRNVLGGFGVLLLRSQGKVCSTGAAFSVRITSWK